MFRVRINALLANAAKNPLTIIRGGAGSGKSQAVADFIAGQNASSLWLTADELKNATPASWSKLASTNCEFVVFDDLHLITSASCAAVLEPLRCAIHALLSKTAVFIICREFPPIDLDAIRLRQPVPVIGDLELNFTQIELMQLLDLHKITLSRSAVAEIIEDTGGWVFAVNLVVRSLQNAPGYFGYVQNSMRKNIFALMEREAWSEFSPTLRNLILCVSLTRHLAADLVADLCDYEPEIFDEFKAQSAYIRYDSFSDSYSLHPFYLAFLHTKHSALTSRDLHKTYESAARWCERNDFLADALTFYEKIADYDAIVCVLLRLFLPLPCPGELPPETTVQTTKNIAALFEGAPDSAFDNTQYFAALHIAVLSSLSRFDELFEHSNLYEQKLLALTQKSHDSFGEFMELYPKHCSTLCCFYFFLGIIHSFRDPCSDSSALPQNRSFCDYFALMNNYMTADFSALLQSCDFRRGQWLNLNCSDAQNAPQIYADALIRADRHAASQSDSISTGAEDLIIAEYHFYRGDFQSAEPLLLRAAQNAHTRASFDTLHRTLFYRLRTAAAQGDYSKFEDCFRETQLLLSEKLYALRFLACDITGAWYNAVIRRPDHFADWLKDDFAPHAAFGSFDEFANHTKARHLYLSRHYLPLLGFFARSKSCKIALYGRVELLALEACTHYKNNNISAAFATLEDAYLAASANFITTPFAELGKDMRTLASAALKCEFQSLRIPREWLDDIRRKSSTYAKHQSFLIQSVHQLGGVEIPPLSAREKDILRHLCRGLSRPEIMAELSLSRSRINTAVDKIYEKLKAANVADAIRIAIEHKLV